MFFQEGGSFTVVFDLAGFELDASISHQAKMVAPDSAWVFMAPNTTVWKDHGDLVLRPGLSGARPDTWRIRCSLDFYATGVSDWLCSGTKGRVSISWVSGWRAPLALTVATGASKSGTRGRSSALSLRFSIALEQAGVTFIAGRCKYSFLELWDYN